MADLDDIDPKDIPVVHDDDDTGAPDANPDASAEADEDAPTDPNDDEPYKP